MVIHAELQAIVTGNIEESAIKSSDSPLGYKDRDIYEKEVIWWKPLSRRRM